jgi:hypothetical protein
MKRISTLGRRIVFALSLTLLFNFSIKAQCLFPQIPSVYKQDFGLGARPSTTTLTNGETPDLIYQPPPANMDAEKIYTLSPTSDLHSNPLAWHHIPDHSVNNASLPIVQQGRMMVVNDREPAGIVFIKTFPSSTFGQGNVHSMSYWVANILTFATCHYPGNDPDIYMSIKVEYRQGGSWFTLATTPVLQIASTPSPAWNKQTINFSTPAFVYDSIRFSINNNSTILCGNDYAIDDIEITKCTSNIILPVDLVNFKGNRVSNGIDLNWITANEDNVSVFVVERSANGKDFSPLNSVNATGSRNNTYDMIDAQPVSGRNYYRLKVVDKDGKFKYSQIISLNWNVKGGTVLVFPNPATGKVNIEIPQEWRSGAEVSLINYNGQELMTGKYQNTSVITLPLDAIGTGIYMLKIKQLNGDNIIIQKLSVNR